MLAPQVEALVEGRDDTTLRVIDIGSGDTPVANQHRIQSVPHLVLYQDGREVASGVDAVMATLRQ